MFTRRLYFPCDVSWCKCSFPKNKRRYQNQNQNNSQFEVEVILISGGINIAQLAVERISEEFQNTIKTSVKRGNIDIPTPQKYMTAHLPGLMQALQKKVVELNQFHEPKQTNNI